MIVRVGIPASFQFFSGVCRELGAPALVSANALRRRSGEFRRPPPDLFSGCDVALDSAGFVAMVKYKGFPWTIKQYVGLAAAYPWAWWAAMDYCCEPEVADDNIEIAFRQGATFQALKACQEEADAQGVQPPMPVLQGWSPDDYRRFADRLKDLPPLVGVGSVCRRHLHGPTGLIAVVDAIDRALPPDVQIHLFGIKGPAVKALYGHPRIYSTDSMAWDFAARKAVDRAAGGTFNLDHRAASLRKFWARHQKIEVDFVFS